MRDKTNAEKKVNFSTIQFREYPICVGDNPGGKRGVPLAIDWKHVREYQIRVDDFEGCRPPRRFKFQLELESLDRLLLVQQLGYSWPEITQGMETTKTIRDGRRSTRAWLRFSRIHEMWERIQRATLNATIGRNAKRRERAFLEYYCYHTKGYTDGSICSHTSSTQPTDISFH